MSAVLAESVIRNWVPQIVNHDIMDCTAEGVIGNHLYSGRALAATEPGDLIQLHPDLQGDWPFIHDHYQRVGLHHTEEVLWDIGHEALAAFPDRAVSVFFFGPHQQHARPDAAWFESVAAINSKNRFMELAHELGVPVPDTRTFADVRQIDAQAIAEAPYPCYLKAAVSVSGLGIYRCQDAAELAQARGRFEPGTSVQIQQEVVTDTFLNLQYEVRDGRLHRLVATEQVLDGFVHQGNRYPACCEPWDVVEPLAEWLHEQGIRGVFAFDVAVVTESTPASGPMSTAGRYLAIECNPRFNGASYPTVVAQKLGIEQWLARTFCTRHRVLADIDLSGIEFDPATGTGVVLVNWGPVRVGKLMVLLAGDPATQADLEATLERRLQRSS